MPAKKLKQKLFRGSVLVFSLVILFVMLAMALGIASVTVLERKMSGTTGKSMLAFQIADSGVELILQKLNKDTSINIGSDPISKLGSCSSGKITSNISNGTSELTFVDSNSASLSCSDNISEISRIKSVGTYSFTSRAVETAWAAPKGFGGWVEKAPNTQYTADADGIVTTIYGGAEGQARLETPVGTVRASQLHSSSGDKLGIFGPVKKGDTWKVVATTNTVSKVYWLPLSKEVIFGTWAEKAPNTQYTADADGIVTTTYASHEGQSSVETPVGTPRSSQYHSSSNDILGTFSPVRKGDTWKVSATPTGSSVVSKVYWLPLDKGTVFGDWTEKVHDTQYTADADGFVTTTYGTCQGQGRLETPVGTVRASQWHSDSNDRLGLMSPVRNGDTWEEATDKDCPVSKVYWLPLTGN